MNTPGPHSKSEIRDSLRSMRTEGLTFWSDIAPGQFASAIGSAWSPADNVRHLAKATVPVALALRLPRIALRAMFGVATDGSRTFDELRQTYLGILSKGATAGRFAPSPTRPPADLGAWQQHLVGRCAASIDEARANLLALLRGSILSADAQPPSTGSNEGSGRGARRIWIGTGCHIR